METNSRPCRAVPEAYHPLIGKMRFYIEPQISCSRFFGNACFTEESIAAYRTAGDPGLLVQTDVGSFIAQHLRGGVFIDVPCGRHDLQERGKDFDITVLAAALGARTFWEADITADVIANRITDTTDIIADGSYRFPASHGPSGTREEYGMKITTAQDDLLGFITKIQELPAPAVLYISAVQPHADVLSTQSQEQVVIPYLHALYDECARVCRKGDLLVFNSGAMLVTGIDENMYPMISPVLSMPPRGFTLAFRDTFDKVQVFRKD